MIHELYDATLSRAMRWFTNLDWLSPSRDIRPSPQRTNNAAATLKFTMICHLHSPASKESIRAADVALIAITAGDLA
jgi:hypothetical protein